MVSSRPWRLFFPRNMTPKNAKPLAHFDVNAPVKQKKQLHKSKCQVKLFEILKSKCLKIWIWNQKLVTAATSPLLLEASWQGNRPTSFTINTTLKGHEHRCHIWVWWFGYVQIYQNHLQTFEIWMDVDGIICTVIVHFRGRLRMWITNKASHSIYLAPKKTCQHWDIFFGNPPNPTRLIPQLNLRETQLWSSDELQDLRVQIYSIIADAWSSLSEVGRFTLITLSEKHIFQLLLLKCHESWYEYQGFILFQVSAVWKPPTLPVESKTRTIKPWKKVRKMTQ